jgi:Na+-transporting NADH:ubiquinone oxidoreductase subunit B
MMGPRHIFGGRQQNALRPAWTAHSLTLVALLSLTPLVATAIHQRGASWLIVAATALMIIMFWQVLFALVRTRTLAFDGLATAISFALLAPAELTIWQLALSLSFGVILGQEIFGGRGRNFLNPAVVSLSFLTFSFPDLALYELQTMDAIAVLPGAILLLVSGIISWRIIIAAAIAFLAAAYLGGIGDPLPSLMTGSLAFALIFFVCDPIAAASSNGGRWVYGALFGGVAVLLGATTDNPAQPIIFAALLASLLSPLVDQGAIHANAWRRRWRNG